MLLSFAPTRLSLAATSRFIPGVIAVGSRAEAFDISNAFVVFSFLTTAIVLLVPPFRACKAAPRALELFLFGIPMQPRLAAIKDDDESSGV